MMAPKHFSPIEPVLKRLLIECEVLEIPNGATHDPAALVAPNQHDVPRA